jgi:hypothetical protein
VHTVVPTVSFDANRTKQVLKNCKAHGVSISSALFAICNIAWARILTRKKELPMYVHHQHGKLFSLNECLLQDDVLGAQPSTLLYSTAIERLVLVPRHWLFQCHPSIFSPQLWGRGCSHVAPRSLG